MSSFLPDPPQRSQAHTIRVSSLEASSGSSSDFILDVSKHQLHGITRVRMLKATVPNTMYNITSRNNKITAISTGAGGTFTATLTPGQYDATTLATEIATQMTASDGTNTYTGTYSTTTLKITITANTDAFKIDQTGLANALTWHAGLEESGETAQALAVEFPNVAVVADYEVYLCIKEFHTDNSYFSPLRLDVGQGSIASEIVDNERLFITNFGAPRNISTLHVRLVRYNGEIVELQGAPTSFHFALH